MSQKPIYEITIDSDWITTAAVAVLLLVGTALAISDARHLFWGRAFEQVSLSTIILALYCLVFALSLREKLLKLAFGLIGIQASARVILSYVYASYDLRHVAAICEMALNLVGLLIMIFVILKWFRSVVRKGPRHQPEDPTS
jgi:hypothetical protein